jgi:hypothetical protein
LRSKIVFLKVKALARSLTGVELFGNVGITAGEVGSTACWSSMNAMLSVAISSFTSLESGRIVIA